TPALAIGDMTTRRGRGARGDRQGCPERSPYYGHLVTPLSQKGQRFVREIGSRAETAHAFDRAVAVREWARQQSFLCSSVRIRSCSIPKPKKLRDEEDLARIRILHLAPGRVAGHIDITPTGVERAEHVSRFIRHRPRGGKLRLSRRVPLRRRRRRLRFIRARHARTRARVRRRARTRLFL